MTIREDILFILRRELGEGHERDTLSEASKVFVARSLRASLIALYKSRIDTSVIISARQAMEQALADEESAAKAIEDAVPAQVDADLGGF